MNIQEKRLAIFVPSLRGGGAERVALNLVRELDRRSYSVDLVLAEAQGPYLDEVPDSVRVVDFKSHRVLISLPALVRYLRRDRPVAMLSVMNHTNIIALWARRLAGISTRLAISEHNTLSAMPRQGAKWRSRLMPYLMKRFYGWADGIVAVSQGVGDDLARTIDIPRDRIQVIYNPVVTPELQAKAQADLEHPWFAPGQPPVLLAVGRLRPQKDFETLIRAFAQVRKTRSARLLILGEGEERSHLETLVAQLGLAEDVSLPGFVENPYAYMARASLFVLSSRWEGLPTVLIEAMYCGARAISTDCPSGPREILKGGQYGQLVPVGDVEALARAIETALTSNAPRSPQESWQPFALETVVEQYLNILLRG